MLVRLAPGTRLEALGDTWVAFSPSSGDTLQLNSEAAAVLELLAEGASTELDICAALAEDAGVPPEAVSAALVDAWSLLDDAGLIRRTLTAASA